VGVDVMERKQPQETGTMSLQVLAGNGMVNLIFHPYEAEEVCLTVDKQSYALMVERLKHFTAHDGHDLMSFRVYQNELPFDYEEVDDAEV